MEDFIMKKLFVIVLMVLALVALPMAAAFAGVEHGPAGWYEKVKGGNIGTLHYFKNGHPVNNSEWEYVGNDDPPCNDCDITAEGHYNGFASNGDRSYSRNWTGDEAGSSGSGYAGGTADTYATGADIKFRCFKLPGFAFQMGDVVGDVTVNSWSFVRDTGFSSAAGAGTILTGEATSFGLAMGSGCCPQLVDLSATIGGSIQQFNYAGEVGYGSDFVEAGSSSFAEFEATNYGGDQGCCLAADSVSIEGSASVLGGSYVTIDPYGPNQSLHGCTFASSNINVGSPDYYVGVVGGSGMVQGQVSNGGTGGGGYSSFSYTGTTSGYGNAQLDVQIHTGYNSSSVHVSGSSFATGN
jgi:hypothetical protein